MADRADRGRDFLAGRGPTNNFSGYGNKSSMPICEREYIAEITPTAEPAFSLQQFPVNPGQAAAFPWLARIAQNFEKYEFEFLRFIYKREVSEFATNGVTGKVIMSFDTDASDPAPINKQQMLDTDPHADGMPCESFFMDIPQEILQKFNDAHFVRPGVLPANTDLKTYDIGTLNVACQGTAANTTVGELHVEYALRLRVPVMENTAYGSGTLSGATGTSASIIATSPSAAGNIQLSSALDVVTATPLQVGAEYNVSLGCSAAANSTVTFAAVSGCTLKNQLIVASGATNSSATFTATATTATFSVTTNGNVTNPLLVMAQIAPQPNAD